jgi:type III pantothenate kinase
MANLIIDIGNTNIVFGVTTRETWIKVWRIQTDWSKTADEYEVIFRSLLAGSEIDYASISRTVLSSVVPGLIRPFKEMITRLFGTELLVVGPEMYGKLPVKVLNPYEIGTDLVADATAVFMGYGGPAMVIDFGTALTFTSVSQSGEILGVAIAPGLLTALKSLTGNAAQLHDVQLDAPPSVLGENTVHAIQSGIVLGFAGLVDSIVSRTEKEIGSKLKVVATGGLSFVLKDVSEKIEVVDENLTMNGLRYMAFNI